MTSSDFFRKVSEATARTFSEQTKTMRLTPEARAKLAADPVVDKLMNPLTAARSSYPYLLPADKVHVSFLQLILPDKIANPSFAFWET